MGLEGPAAETPGEASEAPSPPSVNPVAALASGCGMRGSRLVSFGGRASPDPAWLPLRYRAPKYTFP